MSTHALEVQDRRSAALAETAPDGFTAFIQKLATSEAVDVEKAKALMELYLKGQRGMQEMADEREYYQRMADFKENPPEVIKRLTAKIQGSSKSGREYAFEVPYADLNAYAEAAMADLARRGITWDFEITETPNELKVTCLLHYGLYTRRGSPATGDPKVLQSPNPFMQKGAAQSFLMRYSFCASTGLTAALPSDKNGTTLGQKAEPEGAMDKGIAADFLALIQGSGSVDELQTNYFKARDAAEKANDNRALHDFAQAKNKMYLHLAKAGAR